MNKHLTKANLLILILMITTPVLRSNAAPSPLAMMPTATAFREASHLRKIRKMAAALPIPWLRSNPQHRILSTAGCVSRSIPTPPTDSFPSVWRTPVPIVRFAPFSPPQQARSSPTVPSAKAGRNLTSEDKRQESMCYSSLSEKRRTSGKSLRNN